LISTFPKDAQQYADLSRQSSLPRYRLTKVENKAEAQRYIDSVLGSSSGSSGKKLMWVVNTVARSQELFRQFNHPTVKVLCYHSRFRLKDRKARHQDVINTFRNFSGPLLLITTQVCEMSLDLDADILVTELAPVSSLIQRMGRCCREPVPAPGRIGEVLIYRPEIDQPYEREEIEESVRFIDSMLQLQSSKHSKALSQDDLSAYLDTTTLINPFAKDGYVGFLDSGMYAYGGQETFREGDNYTVDAILDEDIEAYIEMREQRRPEAVGLVLPVPRWIARQDKRLGRFLRVAPGNHYSPEAGFCNEVISSG